MRVPVCMDTQTYVYIYIYVYVYIYIFGRLSFIYRQPIAREGKTESAPSSDMGKRSLLMANDRHRLYLSRQI